VSHDRTLPTDDERPGRWQLTLLREAGPLVRPLEPGDRLTIGRGDEATIVVDDPRVSRVHLEIRVDHDVVVARDLGSRNGTRLAGRPLAAHEPATLRPGDALELGSLLVVLQSTAPTEPRPTSGHVAKDMSHVVLVDPVIKTLATTVERVAAGTISVLLLGETGVGKEIFAEMVHRASPRAAKPLLRLHCAALAENLLEAELFGYEKGAFTGAVQTKPGLLESADGGTVFLDEVGELPAAVQVKLLRVLEERRVTRVGGLHPRDIDIRVVAATHRDLRAEIAAGRFRQDLFFRLDGIALTIPPLRERPSELEPLARHFLAEGARRAGRAHPPALTPGALARLRAHAWPGNLRELRNIMERAVLLAGDGPIEQAHIQGLEQPTSPSPAPAAKPEPDRAAGLRDELARLERQRIVDALERCGGNQTRAAELLGMPRRTFVHRLDEYGITRPRKPS
jgi:two-component system response regulator AtoC